MYKSLITWRDLTDKHLYHEGDEFPFDGRDVSEERINQLTGSHNLAEIAVIKRVDDPVEEIPVEKEDTPVKPRKTRKKTTE